MIMSWNDLPSSVVQNLRKHYRPPSPSKFWTTEKMMQFIAEDYQLEIITKPNEYYGETSYVNFSEEQYTFFLLRWA